MVKSPTIDDHVNSIIANNGPVILKKRVFMHELNKILQRLEERVRGGTAPESLLSIKPYDFHRTTGLWGTRENKNYPLARELIALAVDNFIQEKGYDFPKFVQTIRKKPFMRTPVNEHGTKTKGAIYCVYNEDHRKAIIDMVNHNPEFAEYRDLNKTDFARSRKLRAEDCREITHERIQKLMKEKNWKFSQMIDNMNHRPSKFGYRGWKDFFLRRNRYGSNIQCALDFFKGSPGRLIIDLVMNYEEYCKNKDLRTYDFNHHRNNWRQKNGSRNYRLAREATGVLMRRLGFQDMTFPQIVKQLNSRKFAKTKINRYGTTLGSMAWHVYGASFRKAVQDWYNHGRETALV